MTEPHHTSKQITVWHGDCLDVLRQLPDASVDSIVTDPPYGLEFMGKDWDSFKTSDVGNPNMAAKQRMHGASEPEKGNPWASERKSYGAVRKVARCLNCGKQKFNHETSRCHCPEPLWDYGQRDSMRAFQAWCEVWAAECLRVLRPGGHMLAFGGTRTFHRLACAVEDAGFEIRDSIAWLYGQGFPKSLDVRKAMDRAATTDAARWQGWGTALKPSHEPVVVARKPLGGTVAANVLAHGTGALNIDACRVEHASDADRQRNDVANPGMRDSRSGFGGGMRVGTNPAGRWPPNVAMDEHTAKLLDQQSGDSASRASSGRQTPKAGTAALGDFPGRVDAIAGHDDAGGASRFMYVAKADASERPRQLGTAAGIHNNRCGTCGHTDLSGTPCTCAEPQWIPRNSGPAVAHPTVKPLDLMRWLVRLVTPPGGLVLDPFAGSGTTGEAALLEGFRAILIERETDYLPFIMQRIHRRNDPVAYIAATRTDTDQPDLFGDTQ